MSQSSNPQSRRSEAARAARRGTSAEREEPRAATGEIRNPKSPPIRVLLADDHTIVRKGLLSILEDEADLEVVGEAEDGREAIDRTKQLRPDVLVIDISMPLLTGLEATRQIKAQFPEVEVIVLTVYDNEEYVFQVLRAGASGYLVKKAAPEELIMAIRAVSRGESYLSPSISRTVIDEYVRKAEASSQPDDIDLLTNREREVLQLIAEGHTNKDIGKLLHISVKTVQAHRGNVMEKLGLHSAAELTRYAISKGLTGKEL